MMILSLVCLNIVLAAINFINYSEDIDRNGFLIAGLSHIALVILLLTII